MPSTLSIPNQGRDAHLAALYISSGCPETWKALHIALHQFQGGQIEIGRRRVQFVMYVLGEVEQ